MKHLKTYNESFQPDEVSAQLYDILQELEDEGLGVGTQCKDGKVEVIVSNHDKLKVTNDTVFEYIRRVIDFLREEGYTTYEMEINSRNMGGSFTDDYDLIDKYKELWRSDNKKSKYGGDWYKNYFKYIKMVFRNHRAKI